MNYYGEEVFCFTQGTTVTRVLDCFCARTFGFVRFHVKIGQYYETFQIRNFLVLCNRFTPEPHPPKTMMWCYGYRIPQEAVIEWWAMSEVWVAGKTPKKAGKKLSHCHFVTWKNFNWKCLEILCSGSGFQRAALRRLDDDMNCRTSLNVNRGCVLTLHLPLALTLNNFKFCSESSYEFLMILRINSNYEGVYLNAV